MRQVLTNGRTAISLDLDIQRCVLHGELMRNMPAPGLFGLGLLHTGVLLTTITITPLLFIPTMRRLAMLSSMGFVSTVLVTLAVAAATVVDPHRKAIPQQVRCFLVSDSLRSAGLRHLASIIPRLCHLSLSPQKCQLACMGLRSRRQGTRSSGGASSRPRASLRSASRATRACRRSATAWRSHSASTPS